MHPVWLVLLLLIAVSACGAEEPNTRAEFRKLVTPPAGVELSQEVHPLSEIPGMGAVPGLRCEKVYFTSVPGERVAMLVVRPTGETPRRRPAVLTLHGTRGRKEGMTPWLCELARHGFVACATDARWHGELAKADYEEAIITAYRTGKGHPWLYETVTDTIRALDYLQSRADVDGDRLGLMGISMGGMNTWLTAAADPRVKVAVPCIGVTSFAYQLESGRFRARTDTLPKFHQAVAAALGEPEVNARVVREAWSKVLPGILDRFDCPQMLTAIAPRPLLILNGEKDERCPLEGVQKCYAAAEGAYKSQNAEERLKLDVAANTGHAVTPAQRDLALHWFERWLGSSGKQ